MVLAVLNLVFAFSSTAPGDDDVLSILASYNRTDKAAAETLCSTGLAAATHRTMSAAYAASGPHKPSPTHSPSGCYFLCIPTLCVEPHKLSDVPWNGKCFEANNTLVNKFGPHGHACSSEIEGLRARYGPGESWADAKDGGAIVIDHYPSVAGIMRDELRDAGDARPELRDTWMGKVYLSRLLLADFVLLPVSCA